MTRAPQAEIKLGELCNNRCVFCISGHLTHERAAPLLPLETLEARVRAARAAGHRRVTLLGGEPTVQPHFRRVVALAVELGFDEIVIFTNGSRTAHRALMDEVTELGGRFEWRFSFQGGNREAHERTTGRRGSFDDLLRSLERARSLDQKVSVNTCVVKQNYESLPELPELLAPFGVAQVHLDMLHPGDLPEPKKAELGTLLPRYSDLVEALRRTVRGFPREQDVRIGNLPFCIAPDLAPFIHHGGEETWVIGEDEWDKHADKSGAKTKLPACEGCALGSRCAGVYRAYLELHGTDEIARVSARSLPVAPDREPSPKLQRQLSALSAHAPFGRLTWEETRVSADGAAFVVRLRSASGEIAEVWFEDTAEGVRGGYRVAPGDTAETSEELSTGLVAVLYALGRLEPSAVVPREQRGAKSLPLVRE